MIVRKEEYDQLFRLLSKLQMEAPCTNGACVGHQVCDYGVSGSYGGECAIDVVRGKAESMYNMLSKTI